MDTDCIICSSFRCCLIPKHRKKTKNKTKLKTILFITAIESIKKALFSIQKRGLANFIINTYLVELMFKVAVFKPFPLTVNSIFPASFKD